MNEKLSSTESKFEKSTTIDNPRKLFIAFTGVRRQKIEEMGYVVEETKQDIRKDVSYYWFVKLKKDNKELVLKGLVDHRFNGGSEPIEITVEKNSFTKEELENLSKLKINL